MIQDFAGISITILSYLGYICAAEKFCKEYLEISRINERLFVIFGFCGGMLINAISNCNFIPNIILTLLNHIFLIGLVVLLFSGNIEKKTLVVSILITATTLVETFCISFLSCFTLFLLHTVKNITVPFLDKGAINLIGCISLVMTILVIYSGAKYLASVFYCKTGKWYIIMAIPLFAVTAAYKMLEEQYSQSERLRHDLKNHIIALFGLLENKEWGKMENYLKNMEDSANLDIGEEITGNRVVDILLCQKRKMAERKNIIWECDVQIPKICQINEFDLCVLFGNILDNAVEACERVQHNELYCSQLQFIDIQARVIKKCFLLEVKNSTDMQDKHKPGFTDKEDPQKHGIGLLNISDVVHKYNGVMNIEVKNGVFALSILVPLSNHVHDIKQAV